jgi:release factor glutamine methyltransferase
MLGISKTELYSAPERRLTQQEIVKLQYLVQRCLRHEPTAYILQQCDFYGSRLYIDERVFIPRPETELLVEKAIQIAHHYRGNELTIVDVGTGSGAIAISLALALPEAKIYATDVSAPALEVAKINCQSYRVDGRISLLHGDLLKPLPQPVNMIVANLPYIKSAELRKLSPEIIDFEPVMALDGGEDGLDKVYQLLKQVVGKILPKGCILLEIGLGQEGKLTSWINMHLPQADTELFRDLGGVNRVVKIIMKEEKDAS